MVAIFKNNKKSDYFLNTYNKNGGLETMEEVQEIVKIQKRHFKKGEFFMMHDSLPDLIIKKKYNGTIQRVLFYLLSQLDFNNRIKTFRQNDLATILNTSQPNISKSLKTLEQDNVILKKELDYYFNSRFIKGAGDEKI